MPFVSGRRVRFLPLFGHLQILRDLLFEIGVLHLRREQRERMARLALHGMPKIFAGRVHDRKNPYFARCPLPERWPAARLQNGPPLPTRAC